jgi:RND family efflux transporter MFP subunit
MRNRGIVVGFIALMISLLILTVSNGCSAPVETKASSQAILVETAQAQRSVIEEIVRTKGTLFAVEEALIGPKLPGKIEKFLVDEGTKVQADQPVALIEDTQYKLARRQADQTLAQAKAGVAQARADVAKAEANFENVNSDFERIKRLYEKESIAKQKYDYALTGFRVAEATLKQAHEQQTFAEARLEEAQIGVDLAQTRLDDTKVTSPIKGVITRKLKNLGELVAAGTPILLVERLDVLDLKAELAANELSKLHVGLPVTIYIEGFAEPITARIDEVRPGVDKAHRTIQITGRIDNSSGRFSSGLFAAVDVGLRRDEHALTIPKEALMRSGERVYVFRVRDGRAEKTDVTTGIQQGDNVEILSGLEEGEIVVTAGRNKLAGGETVTTQRGDN